MIHHAFFVHAVAICVLFQTSELEKVDQFHRVRDGMKLDQYPFLLQLLAKWLPSGISFG